MYETFFISWLIALIFHNDKQPAIYFVRVIWVKRPLNVY